MPIKLWELAGKVYDHVYTNLWRLSDREMKELPEEYKGKYIPWGLLTWIENDRWMERISRHLLGKQYKEDPTTPLVKTALKLHENNMDPDIMKTAKTKLSLAPPEPAPRPARPAGCNGMEFPETPTPKVEAKPVEAEPMKAVDDIEEGELIACKLCFIALLPSMSAETEGKFQHPVTGHCSNDSLSFWPSELDYSQRKKGSVSEKIETPPETKPEIGTPREGEYLTCKACYGELHQGCTPETSDLYFHSELSQKHGYCVNKNTAFTWESPSCVILKRTDAFSRGYTVKDKEPTKHKDATKMRLKTLAAICYDAVHKARENRGYTRKDAWQWVPKKIQLAWMDSVQRRYEDPTLLDTQEDLKILNRTVDKFRDRVDESSFEESREEVAEME